MEPIYLEAFLKVWPHKEIGKIHDKLIKYRGTNISLPYIVSRCSDTQYFGNLLQISLIFWNFTYLSSVYHDILGRSRGGQRGMCSQTSKITYIFLRCEGSNPSQKVWLATSQPLRQVCPLVYNVHQIYIKSNSSYKHNFFKNVLKNKLIIIIL